MAAQYTHIAEKFGFVLVLCVLASGFFVSLTALPAAWQSPVTKKQPENILNGTLTSAYENAFAKKHILFDSARNMWGNMEYLGFKDGRNGVLIGENGWLFSTEEFSVTDKREDLVDHHIGLIEETSKTLENVNIALIIALVPAKARLYQDKLDRYRYPAQNAGLYDHLRDRLNSKGLNAPDLYKPLTLNENSFLRTDTHWSPQGAKIAAQVIAHSIAQNSDILLQEKTFITNTTANTQAHQHTGDLVRYIPGAAFKLKTESVDVFETTALQNPSSADVLFGDEHFPVTLVGTSYSANPLWHFEGHLKQALQADVLNFSDEGQGPFQVMKRWLSSAEFSTSKPQIVIWEIPERYFVLSDANHKKL